MDKELLKKAKKAESVESLISLAEENNIELSNEEAEKIFTRLNSNGELSDDDLDAVSGGGCSEYVFSGPKYVIGHYVNLKERYRCYDCHSNFWIVKDIEFYLWKEDQQRQYKVICANCGYDREVDEEDIAGYGTNV